MTRKHYNTAKAILAMAVAVIVTASCSNIEEDERLIYIAPPTAHRHVLIEDFTGQNCANCPKATEALKEIQEAYQEENVIVAAIHSGRFGFAGSAKYPGFMNDLGKTYWNSWFNDSQGQPVAKINRGNATEDYGNWMTEVGKALESETSVGLETNREYDRYSRQLTIYTYTSAPAGTEAKYQLWLTEDSLTSIQRMPDGTIDYNYVHNNVLREAINGDWGESITYGENELSLVHKFTIPEAYVDRNCKVIAFVYDETGVLQVNIINVEDK